MAVLGELSRVATEAAKAASAASVTAAAASTAAAAALMGASQLEPMIEQARAPPVRSARLECCVKSRTCAYKTKQRKHGPVGTTTF